MCYYFDDIKKIEDFDFNNILVNEKWYGNVLVYNISCKTLIGAKPLYVSLDKVNEFIITYDGTRYFVLFEPEKYDVILNRIRYLIEVKSSITYEKYEIHYEKKVDISCYNTH